MGEIVGMKEGQQVPQNAMDVLMQRAEVYRAELTAKLDSKIPRDVISKREAGNGRTLDYLEGWYVIARLNEVFGQGNWFYTTDEMRLVFEGTVSEKKVAHYVAKVTVNALGIKFSDYGYGDGMDKYNPGKAHELAVKEAVTDGIKRAAKNFGMSMGLALYDKSRENVENETEVKSKTGAGNTKRAGAVTASASEAVVVNTTTSTPISSSPITSSGTSETSLVSKAKSRDELNALIRATARTVVAKKKLADMASVKVYMDSGFGSTTVEGLTDEDAAKFLTALETMIKE